MSRYFIGLDAGGTATTALLATAEGEVHGIGRAPGANTWSSGTSVPGVIAQALQGALGGVDPGLVLGGVVAMAGGAAGSSETEAQITDAWRGLGLAGVPRLVADYLAAYVSGTTSPRGAVLVAGTGSVAAYIEEGEVRHRTGGHGWMLGDEGSAVWLGIEAIRSVLRALDGRGPQTILTRGIRRSLGLDEDDPAPTTRRLVVAAHALAPARLGRLAPVVVEAGQAGDQVAGELAAAAARHLIDLVVTCMDTTEPPVIVLAGSLITKAEPINRHVRARLGEIWPETRIVEVAGGRAGATALAIAFHTGSPVPEETLARLREA